MAMNAQQSLNIRQQRSLAMTVGLRKAIGLLKHNNSELTAFLARIAANNPAILLETDAPPSPKGSAPAARGIAGGGTDLAEATLAQPETGLHAHVQREIGLNFRDAEDQRIAMVFAAALEPSGWLRHSVSEVAAEAGCRVAHAEAVLKRLQQMEPAGLFARSLAECLRLQVVERGLLSPAMETLLDNLDLLADGDFPTLARLCNVSQDEVRALLAGLRRLDPKPGARFDGGSSPIMAPDLIVEPKGVGRWAVDLNRASTPKVVVHEAAAGAISDAEAREAALAEARWLERAVSRRNASMLRIASAVVRRQGAFLRRGPEGLCPLSHADIASDTGLHESTVSRVVAGLMVATPRGALPLGAFFSISLGGPGASVAAGAVRHALAALIAREDSTAPLSDSAIATRLNESGMPVARRTVAKYREMQRIPAASQRRARHRTATD